MNKSLIACVSMLLLAGCASTGTPITGATSTASICAVVAGLPNLPLPANLQVVLTGLQDLCAATNGGLAVTPTQAAKIHANARVLRRAGVIN